MVKLIISISIVTCLFLQTTVTAQTSKWVQKVPGGAAGNSLTYNYLNPNTIYGSNWSKKIYVSYDRGAAWQVFSTIPETTGSVKQVVVHPQDSLIMLVALELGSSQSDKILKTTDGGGTWNQTLEASYAYYGIPIGFNPHHPDLMYITSHDTVYGSIDFGSTWKFVSKGQFSSNWTTVGIRSDSSNIFYAGLVNGIWKTTDGGETFRQVHSMSGDVRMIAIDPKNPANILATHYGGGGGIWKTSDYGETWNAIPYFGSYSYKCVVYGKLDPNIIVVGTYGASPYGYGIFLSPDDGKTWTRTYDGLVGGISGGILSYGMLALDSTTIIAQQNNGIYKYESVITGIDDQLFGAFPNQIHLEQNYPNPFNPNTNIEFRIAKLEFASLKIYNVLGGEIATLVNELKQPGLYEVKWDAANVPSGVYYYRLTTSAATETKKMVLLK